MDLLYEEEGRKMKYTLTITDKRVLDDSSPYGGIKSEHIEFLETLGFIFEEDDGLRIINQKEKEWDEDDFVPLPIQEVRDEAFVGFIKTINNKLKEPLIISFKEDMGYIEIYNGWRE